MNRPKLQTNFLLQDNVTLITGASRGTGAAAAKYGIIITGAVFSIDGGRMGGIA
jgi:hypothetical protein